MPSGPHQQHKKKSLYMPQGIRENFLVQNSIIIIIDFLIAIYEIKGNNNGCVTYFISILVIQSFKYVLCYKHQTRRMKEPTLFLYCIKSTKKLHVGHNVIHVQLDYYIM